MRLRNRAGCLSALCLVIISVLFISGCKTSVYDVVAEVNGIQFIGSSNRDSGVDSFLGIPFAKPPVGALRWRMPQPWVAENKVYPAQNFAPACIQTSHIVDWYRNVITDFGGDPNTFASPEMSENCLYLNIWRPSTLTKEGLPVIVYIHGGSNEGGWSFEPNYQGHNIASKGVVVVGIAYRLGVFGFFSHPQLKETNFGLSDQVVALEWIQKHIHDFGGNPSNVTIMGESLGADHVTYLLTSPSTRGLFSKAIHQSGGSSMTNGVIRPEHLRRGEAFGKELFGSTGLDILDRLRTLSAEEILQKSKSAYEGHYFESVIDGNIVTSTLIDAVRDKQIHNVDLLIGSNDDEWLMYLEDEVDIDAWLGETVSPEESLEIKRLIGNIPDPRRQMDLLLTANNFVCPSLFLASQISKGNGQAWVYSFARQREGELSATMGSYHGAELPYIFGTHDEWLPTTEEDRRLSEMMQNYWVTFARTGNPNSSGDGHELPPWPAYNPETNLVQVLDTEISSAPHSSLKFCDILSPLRYASTLSTEGNE